MQRRIVTIAFYLACALCAGCASFSGVALAAGDESPDTIRFEARNLLMRAHGQFRRWRIERAVIDEENLGNSVVEVVVDLASVDTGIGKRDDHLRTADFFDVETYPEAIVVLAHFRQEDPKHPEQWTADVTLDLHGVKRSFPMMLSIVDREAGRVEGKATLRRTDYGVGGPVSRWNPVSVRDEVEVQVNVTIPP